MSESGNECPNCGEPYAWAHPNANKVSVSCDQATSFCILDEGIFLHNAPEYEDEDGEYEPAILKATPKNGTGLITIHSERNAEKFRDDPEFETEAL